MEIRHKPPDPACKLSAKDRIRLITIELILLGTSSMRRTTLVVLCLFAVGCQSESPHDAAKTESTPSEAHLASSELEMSSRIRIESEPAAAKSSARENDAAPIRIKLKAGEVDSNLAPRYSPPGKALKLEPFDTPSELGVDGLQAEVVLGAPVEKQAPIKLLVTRTSTEAPYTKLYVDSDGNGKFDEPAVEATLSDLRGKTWSNFNATLKVKYIGDVTVTEDYPVTFWLTVAAAADRPDVLRVSRRGYKVGELNIGEETVSVVLSDSNNDAVFGEGDWWELRTGDQPSKGNAMRRVGEFTWLGESAFKLEIENAFAGTVRLYPFDPGITRQADELARDPYGADKTAVKAEKPLEFRHDVDAAIAEAAEKKVPCFIKFETTWCGPCKMMTQNVFTAKDVVEAANGVMCVMVDGDERKDLVERYEVKAYPTGVMIAADGNEAARFVGYQKVIEMGAFLKDKREKK
jgi:thiol-disulfide isomerase/thioredoxin